MAELEELSHSLFHEEALSCAVERKLLYLQDPALHCMARQFRSTTPSCRCTKTCSLCTNTLAWRGSGSRGGPSRSKLALLSLTWRASTTFRKM